MLLEDDNVDVELDTEPSHDDPTQLDHLTSSALNLEELKLSPKQNSDSDESEKLDNAGEAKIDDKVEQRRRMDEIVKEHVLDLHVYDRPPRRNMRSMGQDNDFLMSGAIVTGSLDNLLGDLDPSTTDLRAQQAAMAVPTPSKPRRSPRNLKVKGTPALESSIMDEEFPPSSPTMQTKQARRLSGKTTKPVPIPRPSSKVLTPKRIPKVTPVFTPTTSELAEHGKTLSVAKGKDKSIALSSELRSVSFSNAKSPVRPRKETPVPAPQPWKYILPSSGSSGGPARPLH